MINFKNKKITILSGGSAIKEIMFELLRYSTEIIRVVPSTDNGASSQVLREHCHILSVGDIRQALATAIPHTEKNKQLVKFINWRFPIEEFIPINAMEKLLEDKESVLYQISRNLTIQNELFEYLFLFFMHVKKSRINLSNGSIGNFILVAAYFKYEHNWNRAIAELEKLFGCEAKVLPIYLDNHYHLRATFHNGSIIYGESEITSFGGESRKEINFLEICQIENKKYREVDPCVNPSVIKSIEEAELIVFSPGSFFTSILSHLINRKIPSLLAKNRKAKKVFLVNLAQDSETIGYTAKDMMVVIEKIAQKGGYKLNDFITDIIINNHYKQVSFFNSKKEKQHYIQMGNLECYREEGINIFTKDLENPWKRGEFDAKEVVRVLSGL